MADWDRKNKTVKVNFTIREKQLAQAKEMKNKHNYSSLRDTVNRCIEIACSLADIEKKD